MTKNITVTCLLVVISVFAIGCSRQPTVPVPEAEFGDTVRSVMESQIADHEAAIHPNPNAIEGSDPYRLDAALDAYRQNVADPQVVQQPLIINTGN